MQRCSYMEFTTHVLEWLMEASAQRNAGIRKVPLLTSRGLYTQSQPFSFQDPPMGSGPCGSPGDFRPGLRDVGFEGRVGRFSAPSRMHGLGRQDAASDSMSEKVCIGIYVYIYIYKCACIHT